MHLKRTLCISFVASCLLAVALVSAMYFVGFFKKIKITSTEVLIRVT